MNDKPSMLSDDEIAALLAIENGGEDRVNHPRHYEGSTSMECIEAMITAYGKDAVLSFCKCNAFKYIWRHKNKNGREDLEKARWYICKARDILAYYGWGDDQVTDLDELLQSKLKAYEENGHGGDTTA